MVTILEIMRKPIFTEKLHCTLAETVFLAREKPFFSFFIVLFFILLSDIPGSENSFSQGKGFFNEFFIPASGNKFSV